MSRFNLTWRITALVGLALVVGAGSSGLLVWQLDSTSEKYDRLLGQEDVQYQDRARVMQVTFKKQVQEWKDLLLRGRKADDFQKYQSQFASEEASVRQMAATLLTDVKDAQAHDQIQAFLAAHVKMGQSYDAAIQTFAKTKGLDFVGADTLVKGQDRAPTDAIDALVARLQQVVADRRASQEASVATDIRVATTIIVIAFAAILVAVVVMIRSTRREMVALAEQLAQAADSTASAASQVSTSAQALSQGATEQAASLEETSASMEEMASMTRKNAENSQSAATLMSDVHHSVVESNAALDAMVSSMGAIRESSEQVAKIIKTIDEVAFQTNILALNAAVEAARAGEAGMGFAVVADEVRNLAQRSAQAAKDTTTLIEASMAQAQGGSQKVERVATSIAAITRSVSQVKGLVDEVSLASRQQAQGIDQVSQAVSQMERVTQTTAATAEESAAASEELSAQAVSAQSVVTKLERLVGRSTSPAPAPPLMKAPKPHASVTPISTAKRAGTTARPAPSAEDQLPLADTGTFGRF